ncbi:MAG: TonB-dependent receptor, partial [Acidobacteriota bacterium]|nr:TonB-dependent receptor [Acidobacteriota bacterium]
RPQFQKPHLYGILDSLSLAEGAHAIHVGFELRAKSDEFIDVQRRTPLYRFRGNFTADPAGQISSGDSVADLLLGLPDRFTISSSPVVNQLQQIWAGYAQDDWKVTPRLTLNLGLRYEYATPYYGGSPNRNINFNFATGQLVRATGSDKYLVNPDKKDWGPRLGVAYQVVPDRVVLRAGYGLFYNGEDISGSDINLPLNPPQLVAVTLNKQGPNPPLLLSDPIPNNILTQYDTSTLALRARERNWHTPRVHQFNVTTQFRLPSESAFEISYVGNRGHNLIANFDANQTAFGADPGNPANYPYPNFFQIYTGTTRGKSHYNALELKYEKPFRRGLYLLGSYTYASAIDEAGAWGSDNQPQIRDCFACERGPMRQVPRHRFTLAGVYEIPFGRGRTLGANINRPLDALFGGWQLSSVVTWRSGLPIDVSLDPSGTDPITGQPISFNNIPNDYGDLRPNRVGNPNTGNSPSSNRQFLNVSGFALQPVDTPGNSQRNVAHGPRFGTVDLTLVKRFSLTERTKLDIRAEAFNFLNHTNYADPSQTTWGDDGFGVINNAYDPRVVQLAVRVQF